jgi:spermidine synthase
VLGGGDGLAVREILKYPNLESITLVDLDPEMTGLFSTHPYLKTLNGGSLTARKVRVINDDAFVWLQKNGEMFDFVVIDFPDPTNYSLGKLYTTAFYRLLSKHLSASALLVVQSTSPLFARQSYWCIVETLKQAGLQTWPYHVYVPSFGEWGFVLAGNHAYEMPRALPPGLRFLSVQNVAQLFTFPNDMLPVEAEPNRLNDQTLVRYYDHEWRNIAH